MRAGRIVFVVLLVVLAGCSGRFADLAAHNQIQSGRFASKVAVTFFGSSTLLIDDGETQVFIDGFVTRSKHRYLRKIAPSEQQILDVLTKHEICPNPQNRKIASRPAYCSGQPGRGLSIVIPVHAHYDHALDSSYIAAWTGARLVADPSIEATVKATQQHPWEASLDWGAVKFVPPFSGDDANVSIPIPAGKFRITLLRSRHLENPLSSLASKVTSDKLELPAHLWEFGEGTNLSVRIEHQGRSMLIVPSSGPFVQEPAPGSLKSDVVFMGVGGLGWKPVGKRKAYWHSLLQATDAKRVIPIHWDSDQVEFDSSDPNFPLASPRRFDATLDVFEELAGPKNIEIIFAPPLKRFDPFWGLK